MPGPPKKTSYAAPRPKLARKIQSRHTSPPISQTSGRSATDLQVAEPLPAELPAFDLAATAARFNALVGEADRLSILRTLMPVAVQGALLPTARLSSACISEGAASYALLSASARAPFASSLQTAVNLLGRDAVMKRLKTDPQALLGLFASSHEAATIAGGVLADSLVKMDMASAILGEAAYSAQKEAWALRLVDPQLALSAHRTSSTSAVELSLLGASDMRNTRAEVPLDKRFWLQRPIICWVTM